MGGIVLVYSVFSISAYGILALAGDTILGSL